MRSAITWLAVLINGCDQRCFNVSIDIAALPHSSGLYCSLSAAHLGVLEASLLGGYMRLKPSQRQPSSLVCLDSCLQYASKLPRSSNKVARLQAAA